MRINSARVKVAELAFEARRTGSTVSRFTGSGDVLCSQPREMHMFGYPDILLVAEGLERDSNVAQRVEVRCRKCPECLRHRARLWTARAIDETKVSTRTWFGTLTLTPDRQTWARYSALKRLQRRQSDVDEETVFRDSVHILGEELTRFLKRVRKVNAFRYLLVTEAHKSGLPHFHMLLHEYAGNISKRDLEDKWRFGNSHWRLVPPGNEKACGYACKYLAKSALTRVRASEEYGRRTMRLATERLTGVTRFVAGEGNGAEATRLLQGNIESSKN